MKTYVEARAHGDAHKACGQLSEGQRFEMVARVTGNFATASAGQCESLVLKISTRSTAVRPELASFIGAQLVATPGKAGSVDVGPATNNEFLELLKENGEWRIDGSAAEKESFVNVHCPGMGYGKDVCDCIFEQLRRADADPYHSGTPEAAVRQALAIGVRMCT